MTKYFETFQVSQSDKPKNVSQRSGYAKSVESLNNSVLKLASNLRDALTKVRSECHDWFPVEASIQIMRNVGLDCWLKILSPLKSPFSY